MKRLTTLVMMAAAGLVPVPAGAVAVTLHGCYEQRATTPIPTAIVQNAVPDGFTAAASDPLGLMGEYTVRAYRCDDRELIFVTVPIVTPSGFQPGPAGSAALLHAFSEDPAVTGALFAGCFGQVTQDATITFGVIDAGSARAGVVFNDAGMEGVSISNTVALSLGPPQAEHVRLFARRTGHIHALDMMQGPSAPLTGSGVDIFQSGIGPLGTAMQPALVEHRDGDWDLSLSPLDSCPAI